MPGRRNEHLRTRQRHHVMDAARACLLSGPRMTPWVLTAATSTSPWRSGPKGDQQCDENWPMWAVVQIFEAPYSWNAAAESLGSGLEGCKASIPISRTMPIGTATAAKRSRDRSDVDLSITTAGMLGPG